MPMPIRILLVLYRHGPAPQPPPLGALAMPNRGLGACIRNRKDSNSYELRRLSVGR